ncbi:hypothetical protein [uncultured Winogradskyella sp.]|uniref:hypothetical protein n=1 Tax=uncultured Winogradskyella sp. TaxID=395353 RepID=UPI002614A063|nr:hypothetical protein [uncultured Winogradskyella sp.]
MKFYYIFILIVFVSSLANQERFSDLKERNFKGPVKSITQYRYNPIQNNGNWEIDTTNIIAITKYYVNSYGNFTKITKQFLNKKTKSNQTTVFKFEDSKKKSFVKTDSTGIIEKGTYVWTSDYNYNMTVYGQDNIRTETSTQFDKSYRDKSGSIREFVNDSLTSYYTYNNTLNDNGEIMKTDYNYVHIHASGSTTYVNKEYDENNNLTLLTAMNQTSGVLYFSIIREFEYYQ